MFPGSGGSDKAPTNKIVGARMREFSFEFSILTEHLKILFFSLVFIEKHKRLSRIRGDLVEFQRIKCRMYSCVSCLSHFL